MVRRLLILGAVFFCRAAFSLSAAPTDAEAQKAHAAGQCGTLGPGTGLSSNGKGWIVSMLPGTHQFRSSKGDVTIGFIKRTTFSMDAGKPYYITTEPGSTLEWKVPGADWGPVSKLFLYPVTGATYPPYMLKGFLE